MKDYRGATVEDLDSPPAVSVSPQMRLGDALELSFEHSFSYLPVLDSKRRLVGYLTADQLENAGPAQRSEPVEGHYIKFSKKSRYQPITPNTPLEELEEFFSRGNEFAIITDNDRRFVLGVATADDLERYQKARPQLADK